MVVVVVGVGGIVMGVDGGSIYRDSDGDSDSDSNSKATGIVTFSVLKPGDGLTSGV